MFWIHIRLDFKYKARELYLQLLTLHGYQLVRGKGLGAHLVKPSKHMVNTKVT